MVKHRKLDIAIDILNELMDLSKRKFQAECSKVLTGFF